MLYKICSNNKNPKITMNPDTKKDDGDNDNTSKNVWINFQNSLSLLIKKKKKNLIL